MNLFGSLTVGQLSLVILRKRMTIVYIIPGLARKELLCQVYYKARDLALSNNHDYHLAAYAKVRSSYRLGVNSNKKSAKFKRRYRDGTFGYHLHAEMDLIRQFPEGSVKEITVVRFMKNGDATMAMPCKHCQRFLKRHGVKKVYYTNWDGGWEVMKL